MSDFDPFATAPADDEAQAPATPPAPAQAPSQAGPWDNAPAPAPEPVVAIEPGHRTEVVTTFKGDGQAPWVVVHSTTVAESEAVLDETFANYLKKVKKVAGFFAGTPNGGGGGGNTSQRQAPPQGAAEPPAWAPAKPYADFVYKSGISKKNGNTWHAWMPPEKGDNREAVFFYPPR